MAIESLTDGKADASEKSCSADDKSNGEGKFYFLLLFLAFIDLLSDAFEVFLNKFTGLKEEICS